MPVQYQPLRFNPQAAGGLSDTVEGAIGIYQGIKDKKAEREQQDRENERADKRLELEEKNFESLKEMREAQVEQYRTAADAAEYELRQEQKEDELRGVVAYIAAEADMAGAESIPAFAQQNFAEDIAQMPELWTRLQETQGARDAAQLDAAEATANINKANAEADADRARAAWDDSRRLIADNKAEQEGMIAEALTDNWNQYVTGKFDTATYHSNLASMLPLADENVIETWQKMGEPGEKVAMYNRLHGVHLMLNDTAMFDNVHDRANYLFSAMAALDKDTRASLADELGLTGEMLKSRDGISQWAEANLSDKALDSSIPSVSQTLMRLREETKAMFHRIAQADEDSNLTWEIRHESGTDALGDKVDLTTRTQKGGGVLPSDGTGAGNNDVDGVRQLLGGANDAALGGNLGGSTGNTDRGNSNLGGGTGSPARGSGGPLSNEWLR